MISQADEGQLRTHSDINELSFTEEHQLECGLCLQQAIISLDSLDMTWNVYAYLWHIN